MRDVGALGGLNQSLIFTFRGLFCNFNRQIITKNHSMRGLSVEYPMYFGAKPSIFKLAKKLRKDETETEKILWARLNKNQVKGLQFRRQHPINTFIADFYCARIKLVIEIDGSIHEIPEYHLHDIGRSAMLEDFGITVIRFTNEQIMDEIDYVIKQIETTVTKLLIH